MQLEDLIKGYDADEIPADTLTNLQITLDRFNKLEELWGKPLVITNAYRSIEHHLEIYAKKGITDQSKIPMKSKHLYGCAADAYDPDGSLKEFVKADDYAVLKECQLWMEHADSTPNWLHGQILPPRSGLLEFHP